MKSIYLSAKLRDLSLQNGSTLSLLYEVLKKLNLNNTQILEEINKIELFSIISNIQYDLLSFESSYGNMVKYLNYNYIDQRALSDDILFSTTRRFGFSMIKQLN